MRRVVITGAGCINALGDGVPAFAAGLRAGRCGIGALTAFDCSGYRTTCAAEVRELSPPAWLPRALLRQASRSDRFALIAAREALVGAGLWSATAAPTAAHLNGVGVVLGATTGGMHSAEEYYRRVVM